MKLAVLFSGIGYTCDKPLYLIEGGNHSLETGDVAKDIENLKQVMETVEKYICCV